MEPYKLIKNKPAYIVLVLLNIYIINGAVDFSSSGNGNVGDIFTLSCIITPSFTVSAVISQDGSTRSTCVPSICAPASHNNIVFSPNGTGITIVFNDVSISQGGIWRCDSNGDFDTFLFEPSIFLVAILVLLTIGLLIGILIAVLALRSSIIISCALWGRHHNKKKGLLPATEIKLYPNQGDTAELDIVGLHIVDFYCRRCHGIVEPDNISDTEKLTFSKCITSDKDYGVYKIDILIGGSERPETAEFKDRVIQKTVTRQGDQEVIQKTVTREGDQEGKEIKFIVQFQWDEEDLVTIRNPVDYFFADKYTLNGVKFPGVHIVIVAAINQLSALIATVIVLPAVYYGYKKYDVAVGIAVSFALTIVFTLLELVVYLSTIVCCCRKLKSNAGKDPKRALIYKKENEVEEKSRCCKAVLLFVVLLLPVAWMFLLVMKIVNICRGKDINGIGKQDTKEHTRIDIPNQKDD